MKNKKQLLQIKISHSDPKQEKKMVKTFKKFVEAISKVFGEEKPKFYKTKEEAEVELLER